GGMAGVGGMMGRPRRYRLRGPVEITITGLKPRGEPRREGAACPAAPMDPRRFLETKARTLAARARRLASLTPESVGIRPQDRPYAPSPAHYEAANRRLATIDGAVARRLGHMRRILNAAPPSQVLIAMSLV